MNTRSLLASLCCLVACASIQGTQTFETTRRFTLPELDLPPADAGPQTIGAVAAAGETSFAESILADIEELREREHVDSADATVRFVSIRLSTDTTFSGVTAVRLQLATAAGATELCSHTLSPEEQRGSSIRCDADHVMDEAALQQSTSSSTQAQIDAQLDVSGTVTARELQSVVTFEVRIDVDASL